MHATAEMQRIAVRTRLTVLREGATASARLVFCERQGRSVPTARCRSCSYGGGIEVDADGQDHVVRCARVSLESSARAYQPGMAAVVAAALPVGLALARTVTCVGHDVPLEHAARRVMIDASTVGVPVVDADGVLVGVLPRTSLSWLASSDRVADRMLSPGLAVNESGSLGEAFRDMCARRLRELVIVGAGGTLVGLLRDVDAMRFVAHVTRTGLRPGREDDAA